MKRLRGVLVLAALFACTAVPVMAQTTTGKSASTPTQQSSGFSGLGYRGWGVQIGASSSPDQVYGGVHWDLGEFAKNVRFRPLIEFGFGDDQTLIQGMAEATYIFSKVQVWKPYVGGDIGLTYVHLDKNDLPSGTDRTDTDIALMAVGGVETRLKSGTKFFMELKLGIGDDDPDAKVGVGWTWK